jgi:hypothetical protein
VSAYTTTRVSSRPAGGLTAAVTQIPERRCRPLSEDEADRGADDRPCLCPVGGPSLNAVAQRMRSDHRTGA